MVLAVLALAALQGEPCAGMAEAALAVPPPALSADLLLKVAERCPAQRLRWAERAFQMADQVAPPAPLEPVPVGFTDTVPATDAIASGLGLDRLSLKLRAIRLAAAEDAGKAREWMETLRPPEPAVMTCADLVVPQLRSYYDALLEAGGDERFLMSQLFPVRHPGHVLGALRYLARAKLDARAKERLVSILAAQVKAVDADDRSFSVALLERGQREDLTAIGSDALWAAYREYVARHLGNARCADMAGSKPLQERQKRALEELGIAGAPEPARLVESKAAEDLMAAMPEHREWFREGADFDEVRRQIRDWKPPRERTEREVFQVKAVYLAWLAQKASGPEQMREAARLRAELLAQAMEVRRASPAVWAMTARNLLRFCRGKEGLYAVVEGERDAALTLYSRLEYWQPPPEETPVFRGEANLVTLRFSAMKGREFVTDLRREEIAIFEDGKEQTVRLFEVPEKGPLDIRVLIDVSGTVSFPNLLPPRLLYEALVDGLGGRADVTLYAFAKRCTRLAGPTREASEIAAAAARLAKLPHDGTRIYEAVAQVAAEARQEGRSPSPVMVVFSDGIEDSETKVETAIRAALEAGITVYPVLAGPPDERTDRVLLSRYNELGVQTGGRGFQPPAATAAAFERILRHVANEVHFSYAAGYYATAGDGRARKRTVEIRLRDKGRGTLGAASRTILK